MARAREMTEPTAHKGATGKAPVPSKDAYQRIDMDVGFEDRRTSARQWVEYVLMCLCNVAWTIDAAILPMFFNEFQILFGVTETSLSFLSTAKGWAAALFAFPCGFVGELLPRPQLVGVGMVFWASGLALCASATSFSMLFAGRVLNGIGLGVVQPLLLSMVADKTAPSKRGSAFGSLFFVGGVCNTLFGLVATRYAAHTFLGVEGWRVSVAAVAAFSAVVGVLIALVVGEPNAARLAEKRREEGFLSVFSKNMPKVFQLFKYPTFVLILCQGAPGTAPWTIFPFFTQWLELNCFDHGQAGLIFSAFGWGSAFSNLASGLLLNVVSRRFPDHGPPSLANFSVAIGIPFLLIFFFVLPKPEAIGAGAEQVPLYFALFLAFGLGAAMCGTINKKIFSDIVPPSIYTYVFAIDQLVENSLGNCAGLAVGLMTDAVFHYDAEAIKEGGCAPDQARKLGMGMFIVCMVAWVICFSVYLGLQCTYPKDRRRQLALRSAEAEAKAQEAAASEAELGSGALPELDDAEVNADFVLNADIVLENNAEIVAGSAGARAQ